MPPNAELIFPILVGLAIFLFVLAVPGSVGRLVRRYIESRKTFYSNALDQMYRFDEKWTSYAAMEAVAAVMGAALLYAVFTAPIMAVLGGVFGFAMPGFYLRTQIDQRKRRLEELLPDALIAISSSVSAGLALPDAIERTAENVPSPASEEFALMSRKYKSGLTMVDVLKDTSERLNSKYFDLVSVALSVNIERGGDLTEILERIAISLRELHRLEEKIRTETAGPRFEGRIMLFVPPFVLMLLYFVEPELVDTMFNSILGVVFIIGAAILMGMAFAIMNRIVNEEI